MMTGRAWSFGDDRQVSATAMITAKGRARTLTCLSPACRPNSPHPKDFADPLLAGRRLMSMSTAVLRTASPIAAAMISLRLLSLRSPHRLVMTSSASKQQPLMACTLHREEIVARCWSWNARSCYLAIRSPDRSIDANYLRATIGRPRQPSVPMVVPAGGCAPALLCVLLYGVDARVSGGGKILCQSLRNMHRPLCLKKMRD